MSTELKTNGEHPFLMTRYYGGPFNACVQVTAKVNSGRGHWINMSREEALALSADLLDFARSKEIDNE